MISHWLSRNHTGRLIIFCNGWGMDHRPFVELAPGDCDVLILSDYRNCVLPANIAALTGEYDDIFLLGWSFGVWVAQRLFYGCRSSFKCCIAINGTLRPIDDHFGIPHQFFNATLATFSPAVLDRFYRRMCRPKQILDGFLACRPARTVADQKEELETLERLVEGGDDKASMFDTAIVSTADLIIPTEHQRAFWQGRCRLLEVEGCHFPFRNWDSWPAIIEWGNGHG
jgi:biotin synthesis protein BioG